MVKYIVYVSGVIGRHPHRNTLEIQRESGEENDSK